MMAERVLYRIVKTDPPTLSDFLSNRERGLARRENETKDVWGGLSHYDTIERAAKTARRFPSIGTFVAAVRLADDEFRIEQTFRRGHYTVWGDPQALLDAVQFVVPIGQ
jgi:hypothetical protein